jgi:hypothetical protein
VEVIGLGPRRLWHVRSDPAQHRQARGTDGEQERNRDKSGDSVDEHRPESEAQGRDLPWNTAARQKLSGSPQDERA